MQPREGTRRRSAVLATVIGLALCLAALGVWAFGATPTSTTSTDLRAYPAGSAAAGTRRAGADLGAVQRPPGSGGLDPRRLDDLAASEDAAAGQAPGQQPATTGPSFAGELGSYLVGRGIPAGTYASQGGLKGRTCHWFRLKGLSGTPADVVASGAVTGPTRVTIVKQDAFFQTRDCATWHRLAG
ncbi:MAG: hypothetical protein HOP99_06100 [Dermatophilaceae bacterium]|nr:hypothetical protein [Dermatophilaceae bacterium]